MFKKFHDKNGGSNNKGGERRTYQHIKKQKEAVKSKYTDKHTHRKQGLEEMRKATLELINTNHFIYHGYTRNDTKHGEGVMMVKNGNMIFGTWNQDLLDGRALILTSLGGKIMANFNLGKLNGWVLLSYGQNILKCLYFYQNNFQGQKITYENVQKLWISSKCNNQGKLLSIRHAEKGSLNEMPEFIQSEQLKEMISSFVINKENFIAFQNIQQFQINETTNFIGYIDEEMKPSGLGAIYTDKEVYCGNYFEGALEHFGRMVFNNGQIYHGQMIGGAFWKQGIYYSPQKNITSILFTDQYGQSIKKEIQGYIMIDFKPMIGREHFNDKIGIRGETINSLISSLEPYYQHEFVVKLEKVREARQSDNNSQYGNSEEYHGENDALQLKPAEKAMVPKNKDKKAPQKWLKFSAEEQAQQTRYRRSQSVDKRQAAQQRKNGNFDVKIKGGNEYESIPIKENFHKEQAQGFNKQHPPLTKVMQEIHFNFAPSAPSQEVKSLEIDRLQLKNNTEPASHSKGNAKLQGGKISEVQNSDKSETSQTSNQIKNLLQKNKSNRKNIFY